MQAGPDEGNGVENEPIMGDGGEKTATMKMMTKMMTKMTTTMTTMTTMTKTPTIMKTTTTMKGLHLWYLPMSIW